MACYRGPFFPQLFTLSLTLLCALLFCAYLGKTTNSAGWLSIHSGMVHLETTRSPNGHASPAHLEAEPGEI
ncbi:hypothetical protein B0I37DRAFT_35238 [Chaetomium sp. MPI-CAGE-AT-0009]|nr:hypothetical protein B0I37DRAFT_35238 [Chaetomium sp. MPI-CAGE-AT-0009]